MKAIRQHRGKVFPLNRANIDTDQIIPKQFLKCIERSGLGKFLFYNWRFDEFGKCCPEFALNENRYADASILVTGDNFGCGSSREHAPWALLDYGFKVIIAPSFADIFKNNCVKNGILTIELGFDIIENLIKKAQTSDYEIEIDLEKQIIYDSHEKIASFSVPLHTKETLLNGLDEISFTLGFLSEIQHFEEKNGYPI